MKLSLIFFALIFCILSRSVLAAAGRDTSSHDHVGAGEGLEERQEMDEAEEKSLSDEKTQQARMEKKKPQKNQQEQEGKKPEKGQ